jgi:hypothetical protein
MSRYASFLFSFLGRGICKSKVIHPKELLLMHTVFLVYIFVGTILLHDHVLRIIAGSIIGLIGVAYVCLEYIPSVEPPANMRYGSLYLPKDETMQ